MKKIYQKIVDKDKGDCLRACLASLFDLSLEDVPMIGGDSWFKQMHSFIDKMGCDYYGGLHNKKDVILNSTNKSDCFAKNIKWHRKHLLTPKNLYRHRGVNGQFIASVYSPNYFSFNSERKVTHAVLIDKDYNIIHDPNPEYENIIRYPLSDIIGYNGIINVYLIEPNKSINL